jgi:hypothetical protein
MFPRLRSKDGDKLLHAGGVDCRAASLMSSWFQSAEQVEALALP